MAVISFYPNKDATIYEQNPLLNTGLDSIIELQKTETKKSHILLSFDINDVNNYITNYDITGSRKFYLKLYDVDTIEIPLSYTIEVYPLSQSWEMGIGKKGNVPQTEEGVNWYYAQTNIYWGDNIQTISGSYSDLLNNLNVIGSTDGELNGTYKGFFNGIISASTTYIDEFNITYNYTSSFTASNWIINGKLNGNISGSISGSILAFVNGTLDATIHNTMPGGTYLLTPMATQSFEYETSDLRIDITEIVEQWISGSIQNNGLLIKFTDTFESQSNYTNIQYFSTDTHTIYPPRLELLWDEFSFSTASDLVTSSLSQSAYSFFAYTKPLTDLTPYYPTFPELPLYPNTTTWSYVDSYSYTETTDISPIPNKFDSFIIDYPLYGIYHGLLNGNWKGLFTGSISGSFENTNPININCNVYLITASATLTESIMLNAWLPGNMSGTYSGSMFALCDVLPNYPAFLGPIDPIGIINGNFNGLFTGSFEYFSGSYTGSFSGSYLTGSGILISQSLVSASLDGYLSGYITASLSGSFNGTFNGLFNEWYSGSFIGILSTDISGSYSGTIDYPCQGYIEMVQDNLTCSFNNCNVHTTMSGFFTGYAHGTLYNPVQFWKYNITGSRIYTIQDQIILPELTKNDIIVYIKNPLMNIKEDSVELIRVMGRERYPKRTYWNRNTYLDIKYLPSSSYYSIMDAHTDDIVVNFDDIYTRLNCDEDGNYFYLYTKGMQPERLYRFVFKIVRGKKIQIFDNNYIFKITR